MPLKPRAPDPLPSTQLVGNVGSGKSTIVQQHLATQTGPGQRSRTLALSSLTTPGILQTSVERCLERRQGRTFGPPQGQTLTLFLDDVSMPAINEWGDQVGGRRLKWVQGGCLVAVGWCVDVWVGRGGGGRERRGMSVSLNAARVTGTSALPASDAGLGSCTHPPPSRTLPFPPPRQPANELLRQMLEHSSYHSLDRPVGDASAIVDVR